MIVRAAVIMLLASAAFAQAVADSPVRRTLTEAAGGETKKNETLAELIERISPADRPSAKRALDALDRETLVPDALVELDTACALLDGKKPAHVQSGAPGVELVAAATSRLEAGDYAAALALAKEALKRDPDDRGAMSVLQVSKDRVAPRSDESSTPPPGVSPASNSSVTTTDARPLKPEVRLKGSAPPPGLDAAPEPDGGRRRSPWLPYAMTFGAGLVGVGIWLKNARDRASAAIDEGAESALKTGDTIAQRGGDFIQENPKTSIALGAGALALMAWLVLPAVGIGGGGLMYATANGAGSAATVSATGTTVVKGAAISSVVSAPLLMSGDGTAGRTSEQPAADSSRPNEITEDQWTRIKRVLNKIKNGETFDYPSRDGSVYQNRGPGKLPPQTDAAYYREYTVGRAGSRGMERLVIGKGGEVYFSPNHYRTFIRFTWPL